MTFSFPPLVWLPADHRVMGEDGHAMPVFMLGDKYARAVKEGSQAQPVMFPLAQGTHVSALLACVDGVMLTGSPSNVHPSHFDEDVYNPTLPLDPERDALTLTLVRECVSQGVPLLGVCRGFQEINVALGGSLHQAVHEVPGLQDHREPAGSLDVQYGPAHAIELVAGSALVGWANGDHVVQVNSLHGQGVKRLALGLQALAHAPDGLVEAFAVTHARAFAYAFQWHPEWRYWDHPFYRAIFRAFGDAVRARRQARMRDDPDRAYAAAPENP